MNLWLGNFLTEIAKEAGNEYLENIEDRNENTLI